MGELATERVPTTAEEAIGSAAAPAESVPAGGLRSVVGGTPAALLLPPALAFVALVLTYTTVDVVAPAIPALRQSLALSATGAGLVWSVFFGGRLLANLPAALLIGRIGPRWTAAIGAASLLIGSLLAATAGQEISLLIARGLQGVGTALLVNAGLLSLLRAWPGRGAAMTAFNVASGIGTSAGLLSGGLLTGNLGWRAIFWLSTGVGVALLAGALLTRASISHATRRADASATDEEPDRMSWQSIGAMVANLMVYANYSVWVVLLSLYVTQRFAAPPEVIGWILWALNAIHLAAAFPVGRLIRRFGSREVLAAGLAVTAVGLALVPVAPDPIWLLAPLALYAIGAMAGNTGAGDLVLRLGGRGGRAVGMVRLTSDLGLVIGPYAVGRLVDAAGVATPFTVLAALSALGAVAVWATRLGVAAARRRAG